MSRSVDANAEMIQLIDALQTGMLDERQLARLNQLLAVSKKCRREYIRWTVLYTGLRTLHEEPHEETPSTARLLWSEIGRQREQDANMASPFIATSATTAPSLGLAPTFLYNAYRGTIGFFSQELPFSILIAAILTSLGLWFASMVYVSSPEKIAQDSSLPTKSSVDPTLDVVGKITGMVDCKWSEDGRRPFGYDNVLVGRQFKLDAGLLEITYNTGAKVVLQGPVTYEVESKNSGYVSVGKLTAKVEEETAKGFSICTPTAVMTDLGTEFGVEVAEEGTTTSHVFRGSIEIQAVAVDGKTKGDVQILHENQSVRVEKDSSNQGGNRVTVFTSAVKPANFVKEIPKISTKTLDLADIVAGGNGFSCHRDAGIDPRNGLLTHTPATQGIFLEGDRKYHHIKASPFIDGVFIPDGRVPLVQIDSAGHTFGKFHNYGNATAGPIWVPGTHPNTIRTELGGIDYATPGHAALIMHSNVGLTFDLRAIRQANPTCKFVQFRALTGNTEISSQTGSPVYAAVHVFVDGQVRFQRKQINGQSGCFSVLVPIGGNDRFLTLVASDGGNDMVADWIVFGDPRLELIEVSER